MGSALHSRVLHNSLCNADLSHRELVVQQSFAQWLDDEMLCAALSLCEASDAAR